MEKLLKDVLKKITPSAEEKEREFKIIEDVLAILNDFDIDPIVVGSTIKDTDLSGDKDIDIFMRFDPKTSREDLEAKGLEYGKAVFNKLGVKWLLDYSEHPYTKGKYEGYLIELVPCYGGEGINSSVDRTPLHTVYVQAKTKTNPQLKSEIRLLKRFMKAQNVYGAEEKTRGFSGYLVEILTIHYGSFKKVLEATKSWSMGEAIDPENLWGDTESLKFYFTKAPLIVIDPVDKSRNMGAAVSRQKLAEFMIACRDFLDDPSTEAFFPPERPVRPIEDLKNLLGVRGTHFIAFQFKHPQLNENLLYSQLRKTEASIEKEFEDKEFTVFRPSFWSNEVDTSIIVFEMTVYELPKIKHHPGPPVDSEPVHQERFHEKYEKDKPYILEGRWVVDTERKYTTAMQVAEKLGKSKEGFGKNLRKAELEILEGETIFSIRHEDFLKHLDRIL